MVLHDGHSHPAPHLHTLFPDRQHEFLVVLAAVGFGTTGAGFCFLEQQDISEIKLVGFSDLANAHYL